MNPELTRLLTAMGVGLLIGGCISLTILISRWKKGEKLIPRSKPTPNWVWPFGIIVFGSLVFFDGAANLRVGLLGRFHSLCCWSGPSAHNKKGEQGAAPNRLTRSESDFHRD